MHGAYMLDRLLPILSVCTHIMGYHQIPFGKEMARYKKGKGELK
jgi:hypothetical protein